MDDPTAEPPEAYIYVEAQDKAVSAENHWETGVEISSGNR